MAPPRGLDFEVNGARLTAMPCGGLWWADEQLLVVSDLHLEKGSAYAWRGQMAPPYDTRATLTRIAALLVRFEPRRVVSLGDSFHDNQARLRMHRDDAAWLRALTHMAEWTWIVGNHDSAPPDDMGGRTAEELKVGPLVFRHEPDDAGKASADGEICGHLHPCARVTGRGRSVRTRCFATDGRRMVMPAYGAYAGGLNVCEPVFAALFPQGLSIGAIGREAVYAAGFDRLIPDGEQRRWG